MTLLGKILTVLIFVMSLVFMTIALMVYATHRNWHELVNNPTPALGKPLGLLHQLREAEDDARRLQEQHEQTRKKLAMERAARRLRITGLEEQRQQLLDEVSQQEQENARLVQQEREATATLQTAQNNLKRLKDEVEQLREGIRTAQLDRDGQFQEVVRLTDLLNQAESTKKILEARVEQLTGQVGRMAAVLDKNDLTEFDPVIDIAPRVDGEVLKVGGSNLIEISVGSDDGLRKGHKLEISRGSRYLGRIIIRETSPDRAVGEIVPELRKGQIRRGDRVFTKV